MDPNAALKRFRELMGAAGTAYREARQAEEEGVSCAKEYERFDDLSAEAAQTMQALDEWITGGGFLPDEWRK